MSNKIKIKKHKTISYQAFMKQMKNEYEHLVAATMHEIKPKWFDVEDDNGDIIFDEVAYDAACNGQWQSLQDINARYREFKRNSKEEYQKFLNGSLVVI